MQKNNEMETTLEDRIETLLSEMTVQEKIALCSGEDFWHTKKFSEQGIPGIMVSDGPHGLRKQEDNADMIGINEAVPATCFPAAVTSGATWNRDLLAKEAEAIGEEALEHEVAVVLGPGVNIKRNPLCGRNFEYFSEDPYVAGEMGAAFVKGMQEKTGIGCSLKHFACNSQEYKRFSSDSRLDERTLREIYLPAFEKVVKQAEPYTVMCSYNKINGTYMSDHIRLLSEILRKEWGFDGLVVTDWGAMNDRIRAFEAGCDLGMPGGSAYMEKEAAKAVEAGRLLPSEINTSARRVLKLVLSQNALLKERGGTLYDRAAHHDLAGRVAREGIVLLKNEGQLLPIQNGKKVCLVGNMAAAIRYQGAGSSHINPTKLINVTDAMGDCTYVRGCDEKGNTDPGMLYQLEKAARGADLVIVFAGLTKAYESEGFDRQDMQLPPGHNRMIETALANNENVVVVLMGGSPMLLPWREKVKAIVFAGLPGQDGGSAIADVLTGRVNPSGKLTETWPLRESDVPSFSCYGEQRKNAEYREGIYVGYRYYEKAGREVAYPFGHGLSYTEFTYSDLKINHKNVTLTVENTGKTAGAEVVQLYIAPPQDGIFRPVQELKGFEKIYLEPGKKQTVSFSFTDRDFSIWQDGWKVPGGTYEIRIGASSKDIRLSEKMNVNGEAIKIPAWQKGSWYEAPKGHPSRKDWEQLMGHPAAMEPKLKKGKFDKNNTLLEMAPYSIPVRILCGQMEKEIAKSNGGSVDYENPEFKMAVMSSMDAAIRSMMLTAGKVFTEDMMNVLIDSANGKTIQGAAGFVKKRMDKNKEG